jgi:hypothetical protein
VGGAGPLGAPQAHRGKTQGEKEPLFTPNYPKLSNPNNCFRFVVVIQTVLVVDPIPVFPYTPVSSLGAPVLVSTLSAVDDSAPDGIRDRLVLATLRN